MDAESEVVLGHVMFPTEKTCRVLHRLTAFAETDSGTIAQAIANTCQERDTVIA